VGANKVAWQKLVAANTAAVAFMGTGDVDAYNLAAIRGEAKAGWLAGGFGLDPRTLEGVRAGQLFASVSPEHFVKGALAGWLAANHAKTGKALPEGWIYTPGLVVTSANIDQIVHRQTSEATKLEWFKPQIDKMTADHKPYLKPLDATG
jgi:ribose transport system substrate-binding protein